MSSTRAQMTLRGFEFIGLRDESIAVMWLDWKDSIRKDALDNVHSLLKEAGLIAPIWRAPLPWVNRAGCEFT